MSYQVETLVAASKRVTLKAIAADVNAGNQWALAFASEEQVLKLIKQGKICEDSYTRWDNIQEEMRCEMAAF